MSLVIETRSTNSQLDELLDEICVTLQLSDTQFDEAKSRYEAVGTWLGKPDSSLADYKPKIYPQGSVLHRTTVKPRHQEEHDVDLICELQIPTSLYHEPELVLQLVERRLVESGHYKGKVERFKRCVRINYANEFHLDVTPARLDSGMGGTCILVPDRKIQEWKPSNPLGFAEWFEWNVRREKRAAFARKMAPFPAQESAEKKAPLRRAVQLFKRHRDVVFDGHEDAPRSILLTTLAGHHYDGEELVTDSLLGILRNVVAYIDSVPGMIEVPNPSNPGEKFCESWADNRKAYEAFVAFVKTFQIRFENLLSTTGLDRIAAGLDDLFGEKVTKVAVANLTERVNRARDKNGIHFTKTGVGLTVVESSRQVPRNTFYGR